MQLVVFLSEGDQGLACQQKRTRTHTRLKTSPSPLSLLAINPPQLLLVISLRLKYLTMLRWQKQEIHRYESISLYFQEAQTFTIYVTVVMVTGCDRNVIVI